MSIYALVDCNNFYVSCERIFNPKLEGVPVVVLSNNDGVIISRSQEAKKIGIKMAQPLFEAKPLIKLYDVKVFSSNFTLYGDMSRRVMQVLAYFTDDLEIYSVDEAFLDLTAMRKSNLTDHCQEIRKTIKQWTGVPVSIGIGPTKTLAKAANELAKTNPTFNGVLDLTSVTDVNSYLAQLPVEDVWGIGRAFSKKLKALNINTAAEFLALPEDWIKKNFHLPGWRTMSELRGINCCILEKTRVERKSVISSRSFGRPVTDLRELEQATAKYCARATEKLREQHLAASHVTVYITTSCHHEPFYSNSATIGLAAPSHYTPDISSAAHVGLQKIFKPGLKYKKAGIMLTGLCDAKKQATLFTAQSTEKKQRIMRSLDYLNNRYGHHTIFHAAEGIEQRWKMKHGHDSAISTTSWDEEMLPVVEA